jgi:hypothetical protein
MTAPPAISWTDLFASNTPPDCTLELRAIKKSGRSFLFVPKSPLLAAHSLSLYPAQTKLAKLAKSLLRTAIQTGLPLALEKTSLAVSSNDAFPRFLAGLVDGQSGPLPALAILAGNNRTAGCRFLILLFNERGQPAFVVKAGLGDSARQLIRHETSFLHSAPPRTPGLPLLRASLDTGLISAFALDFVAGDSPKTEAWPALGELLSAWVNQEKRIQLRDAPAWQAIEPLGSTDPLFLQLSRKLGDFSFHPVIFHGDLAPWNIKAPSHGVVWNILDWERGDLIGIPGWDWFHYVVQSGILVHKQTPEQLLQKIEELFASSPFHRYADLSGIKGFERLLVIAYLFHLTKLIRPSEGLQTNQSLLTLLSQRWLS